MLLSFCHSRLSPHHLAACKQRRLAHARIGAGMFSVPLPSAELQLTPVFLTTLRNLPISYPRTCLLYPSVSLMPLSRS
jgi:hypothetical protein